MADRFSHGSHRTGYPDPDHQAAVGRVGSPERSSEHQRQIIDTFVNSVYVFDDRVVLNFNFTDDAKTVTREEVLGSSAVDNAPPD